MRKIFFPIMILSLALVTACGGSQSAATSSGSSGSATAPLISVTMGSTQIYSGGGPYPFGQKQIPKTIDVPFTLENKGSASLELPSNISITGTDAGCFSVSGFAPTSVAAGSSITFSITFTPAAAGTFYADVTIPCNDTSVNDKFTFQISGSGTTTAPLIYVFNDAGANIVSGSGTRDFGSVLTSATKAITFTVKNSGTADLYVGTITSTIPGTPTPSTTFTVTTPPTSPITAGNTSTLMITFNPSSLGFGSATITVPWGATAGSTTNSFTFTVTGTGAAAPTVNGIIAFGNIPVGSSSPVHTFYINNSGTSTMTVTGISLTGAGAGFTLSAPSTNFSIAEGSSASFSVIFTPAGTGSSNLTITVSYYDATGAQPDITQSISGTGVAPVINVTGAPLAFANTPVNTTSAASSLTISNSTFGAPLHISSVSIGGSDESQFAIFTAPASPVVNPTPTTLSVVFKPTSAGAKSASLYIYSDDAGSPYTCTLSGTGTAAPAINIIGDPAFGNVDVGSSSSTHTFTIQNTGTATMNVSGVSMVGDYAADYTVSPSSAFTIPAGNSASFSVVFTPSLSGARFGGTTATAIRVSWDGPTNTDIPITSGTGIGVPVSSLTPATKTFANTLIGGGITTASVARASGTATIVTGSAHGLSTGDYITISGTTTDGGSFNISTAASVTVTNATTFTVANLAGTATVVTTADTAGKVFPAATFTISNTAAAGSQALTITSVNLSGANVGDFVLTQPASTTVAAAGSTTFTVAFAPTAAGTRTATVTVTTNDPANPTRTASLTGKGSSIMTIDSGNVGQYTSLAVGPGNALYVSYYDSGSSALKFAVSTDLGQTWTKAIADNAADVGKHSSVAVDGNDLYISYYDTTGSLKVIKSSNSGSSWNSPIVADSSTGAGLYTSIKAVGTSVYVSYNEPVSTATVSTVARDAAGTTATITTAASHGLATGDLVTVSGTTVDGSAFNTSTPVAVIFINAIKFSYANAGTFSFSSADTGSVNKGGLRFAKSSDSGTTWSTKRIVDNGIGTGGNTSLAVDGSTIHIGYYNQSTSKLYYAQSTDGGSTWTVSSPTSSGSPAGEYASLMTDWDGTNTNVLISYYTSGTTKTSFEWHNGSTWSQINIDTTTGTSRGQYTSIATDLSYNCFVAYNVTGAAGTGGLYVAKATRASSFAPWTPAAVDTISGSAGQGTSIATLSDGTVVIVYYDPSGSGSLKFASSSDHGATW